MPANDAAQEPSLPVNEPISRLSKVRQQSHPLTAPGARFHHRGILDPMKTRFVRANSAVAFPRILGMEFESGSVPRLHSFAWHLGIRAEPNDQFVDITTLLTWPDMQSLAKTYFRIVRVEIGLLDEDDFLESASARFANPQGEKDLDAVILGVAALGSFFSPNPHPAEDDFVANARKWLNEKTLVRAPTQNDVAAWILRTIYLRCTARPHAAWVTSCITLNLVEAVGLHKEMQTIAVVYPAAPTGDHKLAKTRRRLFWIAKSLNTILAFEYGRSKVYFDVVTTKKFAADSSTHAHQIVELAALLPSDFSDPDRDVDPPVILCSALTSIENMKSDSSFVNLLRADLAFAIYRRLWLMSLTDAKDRTDSVLSVGKEALEASTKLLETRTPWWNVLSNPFQFLCVVLAIGTPKSLALVSDIVSQLRRITETYDTHMVREAYNQALSLTEMARRRKEKELSALSEVRDLVPFEDSPTAGSTGVMSDGGNIDWASMEMPFDWDIFLNPDLIMSTQQDQWAGGPSWGGQTAFSGPS